MFLADYHIHSNWSHDGKVTMKEIAQSAIEKKIKQICLTDHFEILPDLPKIDYNEYVKEFYQVQKEFEGKLDIRLGVEMGISSGYLADFSKLVKDFEFDYVLASTHRINYISAMWPEFWEGFSKIGGYRKYYEYMLESLKNYSDFDCWGHLDYIIRYGNFDKEDKGFEYRELGDVLDEILKTIIEMGKGIEVNTSYRNKGFDQVHPSDEILKRYIELGGEIITFGSDSHNLDHLGSYIKESYERLENFGLKYISTYKNRKVDFIKISKIK